MTFRTDFPDFPAADFPALPHGFTDSSWHNDACPSMKNETLGLFIFIDYADPTKREYPDESERFIVWKMDADGLDHGQGGILLTNEWTEVLALIASKGGAQ